ncbi:MAG: hypothetical protein IKU51_05705 [Clostridia bacterium]|nr:hypothetical protein [Clostridia bacterium]
MIKGVNRQMIEVTHTGSPYFERAFLVVRADCQHLEGDGLHRLAEKVVQQADTYAGLRRQRRLVRLRRSTEMLLAAVGGAGVCWLFERFLA